jgi:hypothetical protein
MKTITGIAVVFMLSPAAWAGGDSVTGLISAFAGGNGTYAFHFQQTDAGEPLLLRCREFDVSVKYALVPWYSWLPWVHTSHPTLADTEAAAEFLKSAATSHQPIEFGYMGGGLSDAGKPCSFAAKALELLKPSGQQPSVWAYHDPV